MTYDNDYCDEDFDAVEMRRQAMFGRAMFEKYKQERLMRNPDCRDPDHPGCDYCMGDSNGQDTD